MGEVRDRGGARPGDNRRDEDADQDRRLDTVQHQQHGEDTAVTVSTERGAKLKRVRTRR